MGKGIDFESDSLIDMKDLRELEENLPQDECKWLSNFVIDSYLQMIKSQCPGVQVLGGKNLRKDWEKGKWNSFFRATQTYYGKM